jgi:hypothetical protein
MRSAEVTSVDQVRRSEHHLDEIAVPRAIERLRHDEVVALEFVRADAQEIGAEICNKCNSKYSDDPFDSGSHMTPLTYLISRKDFGLSPYWPTNAELLATALAMLRDWARR